MFVNLNHNISDVIWSCIISVVICQINLCKDHFHCKQILFKQTMELKSEEVISEVIVLFYSNLCNWHSKLLFDIPLYVLDQSNQSMNWSNQSLSIDISACISSLHYYINPVRWILPALNLYHRIYFQLSFSASSTETSLDNNQRNI